MAVINMSKNQKVSMVKQDGSGMKNIFVGVNWDENRYAGESEIDFDINGFLTNGDRKITYPGDVVNYRTGDDSTGGMEFNGKHYDEAFVIHADKFPENKTEFTICLTIYRAVQRLQNFGMVNNATLTICDYDNPNGENTYLFDSGYVGGMTELFKNFGLDIDEGKD